MTFIFTFFNFMQPGVLIPAVTDLRPMLVATVMALIIGYKRESEYPRREAFKSPAFVWLMVFLVTQCISVYSTGFGGILNEFGYWNVYAFYVIISVLLITNVTELRRYIWGMMVGSMVVVIYGIYSVPTWGGFEGTGRAGAYGMYENHNDYSFIIVQVFPFLYLYRRTEKSMLKRLLLGLSMVACMAGMFMSLSRGGMMAIMLEVLLFILIAMEGRARFFLIPIMAAFAIGGISYQYAKRAENQKGSDYTAEAAEEGRFELWKAGFKMFLGNPILGVGSRRYKEVSAQDSTLGHDLRGKVSHNTYVEVLANTGIIGIVSFLMLLKSMLKNLRRRIPVNGSPWLDATRKGALIAFLGLLFRAMLDAKPHDWNFYLLCSLAIAIYALQNSEMQRQQTSPAPGVPKARFP